MMLQLLGNVPSKIHILYLIWKIEELDLHLRLQNLMNK
jgi:hypothetical protein